MYIVKKKLLDMLLDQYAPAAVIAHVDMLQQQLKRWGSFQRIVDQYTTASAPDAWFIAFLVAVREWWTVSKEYLSGMQEILKARFPELSNGFRVVASPEVYNRLSTQLNDQPYTVQEDMLWYKITSASHATKRDLSSDLKKMLSLK